MSCAFSRAELRKSKQNEGKHYMCLSGRISGDSSFLNRVQVINTNDNHAIMYKNR